MDKPIVSSVSSAIAVMLLERSLAAGKRISIPSLDIELYRDKDGIIHTVCLVCNGVDVCKCRGA